jgi:TRAP-type uncharacterized transport system fused permease subunit
MNREREKKGVDWSAVARDDDEALTVFLSGEERRGKAFLIVVVALLTFSYMLFRALFGGLNMRTEYGLVVGLVQIYVFLVYPLKGKWNDSFSLAFLLDYLCVFASIFITGYTIWGETYATTETLTVELFSQKIYVDNLMGAVVILLMIEACRRSVNWIVAFLPIVFALYSLFASHFPGVFANPSIALSYLIQELYITGGNGIYGIGTKYLVEQVFNTN